MTMNLQRTEAAAEGDVRPEGLGALLTEDGVAFRVWAPHADRVDVIGSFNDWDREADPMEREGGGCWFRNVPSAGPGDEYKYHITYGDRSMDRIDPRARCVTNSVGNGVIVDTSFDWEGDDFQMPHWNELVIYEMHVGSFHRRHAERPGSFEDVLRQLDHLKRLGVNALQIMPVSEFAGDLSWGYNPAHLFAVESAYGGPDALKAFVKVAHAAGIAVILDVVYNHFGPSDLDLWQFDGWSENGRGGIYFYNDHRAHTPWGDTRPDYGRGEVRQFIFDNAMMWLDEFHLDGLRYDMTLYIRSIDGGTEIPEGWSLTQWINREIHYRHPGALTIAEDLQNNEYLTKEEAHGGAGFSTQWDAGFVHPVRDVLTAADDAHRDMHKIAAALSHRYNGDTFQRVVYTESHDEVANGKSRIPSEVSPWDDTSRFAQKRATLGAGLVMTAPGIPMLFQGQEFLQGGWFQDSEELDWDQCEELPGVVQLHSDLIRLRLNRDGCTAGLTGQDLHVFHVNDDSKVVAYRRSREGGPGDDVVVIANFANRGWVDYRLGFPAPGFWKLRFNSDWSGYSDAMGDVEAGDVEASGGGWDGMPASVSIRIGPYALLIYSQDP